MYALYFTPEDALQDQVKKTKTSLLTYESQGDMGMNVSVAKDADHSQNPSVRYELNLDEKKKVTSSDAAKVQAG